MIISVNWLKKFTQIDLPVEELAALIGSRLVEIEEVIDLSDKYKDVVVARVANAAKLEGSDHLNVVLIDDGGKTEDVERDSSGHIQVVCGASNVREGLLVAWLPPKSTVPETYGDTEPFVLEARKLRGVMSNGMIASARELDLFDEHDGILEIDKDASPGDSFAELYELNDYLLDIENKSLTHRPDTFGLIGFAREVAAIQGNKFVTPEWLINANPKMSSSDGVNEELSVAIDNSELSARYQAVVLAGIDNTKQSPLEIQTYLARVGVRPINAVVDVTNYLMLLTGQPLHAFDYDKLVTVSGGVPDIHVRNGHEGETLELLDGRTVQLDLTDIVIATGKTAIGLAGAMGGASTAIDENTTRIILESATFNLYSLRTTQMRHGIFSEAITRFTKGQPSALTAPVLASAVYLLGEWTDAKQVSDVAEARGSDDSNNTVNVTEEQINSLLGTEVTTSEAKAILENVEFKVDAKGGNLSVLAPYWRTDIKIKEDVIEEVGRLRGFDLITPTLARREFNAVAISEFDQMKDRVRQSLVRAGGNEVLTYSFIHGDVLKKAGLEVEDSYKIVNSISPDLQYYRQTLTPNLLGLIHPNIKQGYEDFAIFEINKTHNRKDGLTDELVPVELDLMAAVVASKRPKSNPAYYEAKYLAEYLAKSLNMSVTFRKIDQPTTGSLSKPFEYRRSAHIIDKKSGIAFGIVGEYRQSVVKSFKLPEHAAGFEIEMQYLFEAMQQNDLEYRPLSRYPGTERDICFKVNQNVNYSEIYNSAVSALNIENIESEISPVDIYQPEDGDTKNITIKINLTPHDRTLNSSDIAEVMERVVESVIQATDAQVV